MHANYRAALRARSKAEFLSKLFICVEDVDETEMWLDLLISLGIVDNEKIKSIYAESIELLKVLASIRKKMTS